jgi:NADH-quinone oxidoreductase subunit G
MNAALVARLGLQPGAMAIVSQSGVSVPLPVRLDEGLADRCVRVPVCDATAPLGDLFGEISVEKAA